MAGAGYPALVPDAPPSVPVTVVTGFLGAGKSTLLDGWLRALPRDEVAVIVNELGEIGLDAERLEARGERLREIAGACICCQGQAALARALRELSALRPGRLFVETSGAASPAGVARALSRLGAPLRLDGVITVVDGSRLDRTLRFDLAREQLAFADVVVASHVDRAPLAPEDRTRLERLAPVAAIVSAAHGRVEHRGARLDLRALLALRRDAVRVLPEGQPHDAIDAVSLVHEGELHEARFGAFMEETLGAVGARLLRLKGIVALGGVPGRLRLQGVGDVVEVELDPDDPVRESRLVVMGLDLDEAALRAAFQGCRLSAR